MYLVSVQNVFVFLFYNLVFIFVVVTPSICVFADVEILLVARKILIVPVGASFMLINATTSKPATQLLYLTTKISPPL